MATSGLNLSKSRVLILKRQTWQQLGVMIKKWIWNDMRNGQVQEYEGSRAMQYSQDYAKYKRNNFRRFTDGKRLKGFLGKAVTSGQVNTVNMLATGELIKGLRVVKTRPDGVTLAYALKDRMKIKGNELLGRSVRTLNDENREKAVKYLAKQYERNLREWAKKPVNWNL